MRLRFRSQLTLIISAIVLATIALISLCADWRINLEFEKYAKEQQHSHAAELAENLSQAYNSEKDSWDFSYVHGVGMTALYEGYIIRLEDAKGVEIWDTEHHDMALCSQVIMDIMEQMEEKRPNLDGHFMVLAYDLTRNNQIMEHAENSQAFEHTGDNQIGDHTKNSQTSEHTDDNKTGNYADNAQTFDHTENTQAVGHLEIQYYGPYFLRESDFKFLASLHLVLFLIGIPALLASIGAALFFAKRISRPLIETAQIATQIAGGNYRIALTESSNTHELYELACAINHMSSSLNQQEILRRRLTSDVAHELRTPLSTLSSHLEAMIEGIWDTSIERLESCYEEIRRISGLVADLEKLAQADSENLQLEKVPLDLQEMLMQAAQVFERAAADKGIVIDSPQGTASSVVPADKDRLMQVITNLLSNAIKYTPTNGVIRLEIKDSETEGVFSIADNGMGIPENDLPLIFERFYRTDLSRSRETGGSGIGLSIAGAIVAAHGGTITVDSELGVGSCFSVSLPKIF
ncbi:sensor histidine kinase [Clostridia bacterium]|nr:sensor histidine kinase [Clostridia bacterium]